MQTAVSCGSVVPQGQESLLLVRQLLKLAHQRSFSWQVSFSQEPIQVAIQSMPWLQLSHTRLERLSAVH